MVLARPDRAFAGGWHREARAAIVAALIASILELFPSGSRRCPWRSRAAKRKGIKARRRFATNISEASHRTMRAVRAAGRHKERDVGPSGEALLQVGSSVPGLAISPNNQWSMQMLRLNR